MKSPPHIVMLLSNAYRPDPRVEREATALVQAGYQVTVIAWDRQKEFNAQEICGGVNIQRVQDVPTRYGSGLRQIFYTPRFWQHAIRRAITIQPDLIHCHDLDTLYAGISIKKRLHIPLVYDAHEDYPALMSLYLPSPLTWLLSIFEKFLIRKADATITASSVLARRYQTQGVAPVTTLGNYQSLEAFNRLQPGDLATARAHLGLTPQQFVVAYIGGFTRNRLLLPLIEAAASLPQVTVLLWGDGHQKAAVETAIMGKTNVHYFGWLPESEVPLYTSMADVIYYCIRPDYPGAVYNAPNTLSNAMAAGRPIIANRVGDLGEIVAKTGCGILLDEVSSDTIVAAVQQLQNPVRRLALGQAGWQAAQKKYNATTVSQELVAIYHNLLR